MRSGAGPVPIRCPRRHAPASVMCASCHLGRRAQRSFSFRQSSGSYHQTREQTAYNTQRAGCSGQRRRCGRGSWACTGRGAYVARGTIDDARTGMGIGVRLRPGRVAATTYVAARPRAALRDAEPERRDARPASRDARAASPGGLPRAATREPERDARARIRYEALLTAYGSLSMSEPRRRRRRGPGRRASCVDTTARVV